MNSVQTSLRKRNSRGCSGQSSTDDDGFMLGLPRLGHKNSSRQVSPKLIIGQQVFASIRVQPRMLPKAAADRKA
jgi:hypothetical protein